MAEVFQVKGIKPKKLNVKAFAKEIQAALEDEGDIAKREYEKTTTTWHWSGKVTELLSSWLRTRLMILGMFGWILSGQQISRSIVAVILVLAT
jgi:hypothetical protein